MRASRNAKKIFEDAREAHRAKRWPEAEQAWRSYIDAAPDDPKGYVNLGLALFALDRHSDAELVAHTLRHRWPENVVGAVLGARVASVGADPAQRVAAWQPVVERFSDNVIALNELGRALLGSGDAAKALVCGERLLEFDRRLGLHLKGRAQDAMQREGDLTDFWRDAAGEFPDDTDFRRKAIQAALWSGRRADVEEGLATLMASGNARVADVNFVIGIANLYRSANEREKLRAVVRAFLHALPDGAGRRLAAVKLSRVIIGDFANSSVEANGVSTRFETMVRRSPASPAVKAWLSQACSLYRDIVQVSASLLETDVSKVQAENFVAQVRSHLRDETSFAFVRLGDGESNAIGYEPHLAQYLAEDTDVRERMWWGRLLEPDARAIMNRRVFEAVIHADMVGIPCAGRAIRDLDLMAERPLESGNTGRGIRAVLHYARGIIDRGQTQVFASAHLHQDLYKHRLYGSLFQGLDGVVTVSPHAELPEVLRRDFGVGSVSNVLLRAAHRAPTRAALAHEKEAGKLQPETVPGYVLPHELDAVVAALPSALRGRLVIVAGGYAGKWIGEEARRRGGVVLDLGSIADYWMGIRSRGYLDLA